MTKYYVIFLMYICLVGCEKAIDIPLKNASDVLVVDATIENDQPPIIYLSKSLNYFNKISPSVLAASFVRNATVTLSDGLRTVKLKEYGFTLGANAAFVYSIDTTNITQIMLGKLNTKYTLTIQALGGTYTATTSIPSVARRIDSIWYKRDTGPDTTKRNVYIKVTDPKGLGNYIRFLSSFNNSDYISSGSSAFNDDIIDGTTYTVKLFKPDNLPNNPNTNEFEQDLFNIGDTFALKLSNIDKATYDFWNTLEFSQQSIGNPFSQPGVVIGNISGGALGYFGGYATQYKSIIIKN
jgi:hypothetical protein